MPDKEPPLPPSALDAIDALGAEAPVSKEVVREGKELLIALANIIDWNSISITPEQLEDILRKAISEGSFASATVVRNDEERRPNLDAFRDMITTLGTVGSYSNNTWTVWFTRKNNAWILNYHKTPMFGYLR